MPRRPRLDRTIIVAALAALGGAAGGAALYGALDSGSTSTTVVRQVTVGSQSQPTASTMGLSVGEIYRRSYRGVVEVTATSSGAGGFGSSQAQAQGSGFVYDERGDIITNQHVIADASSISVKFWNGATFSARLVGADPSTDLAVLRVDAPASLLEPLALGDSNQVAVGDGVVAIGSPFGLEGTVTSGIVSALHRQMTSPNQFTIDDSIQTDAAINHGNSGGPLLDDHGKVIGVNSQIESDSGGNDGVGFAVPSNAIRTIARQLIAGGEVKHAYLGVSVDTIPATVAPQLGLVEGAEVTEVRSGTPAADAGLRAGDGSKTVDGQQYTTGGDVIVALNGTAIHSAAELSSAIDSKQPGAKVRLTYVRDGKRKTTSVDLTARPS